MTHILIPDSQNKENAFYGTIAKAGFDAQRAWKAAIISLTNVLHSDVEQMQRILDGETGEFIAKEVLSFMDDLSSKLKKASAKLIDKVPQGYSAAIEIDAAVRLVAFRMMSRKI